MIEENKKTISLDWQAVDKALAENTISGYKMAVVEAEKTFRNFLITSSIPGKNYEEKIVYVLRIVAEPEKLEYAQKIYHRIINEAYFELSLQDVKTIIAAYFQTASQLKSRLDVMGWTKKARMEMDFRAKKLLYMAKNLALVILGVLFLILFLAETSTGKYLTSLIASTVHFLFYKVFLVTLGVAVVLVVIIAAAVYIETRKNGKF